MKTLIILGVLLFHVNCFSQPVIQWQKTWGGYYDLSFYFAEGYSILQTTDGGYVLAGKTTNYDIGNHGEFDYWILKLDSTGATQWQKALGGSEDDEAYSIQQTTDGGYIVAGYTYSNDGDVPGNHSLGYSDYWVVKLSVTGIIEWQKTFGGSEDDMAFSIQQTTDSGYIVAGRTHSSDGDVTGNHNSWDCWIVKLSAIGTIQWQKSLGGSDWEDTQSIQQTTDGGYIVAVMTISTDGDVTGNHGGSDFWIVKLNATGIIQWHKTLGGSAYDAPNSIQQTTDGGYIVAGLTDSNDGDVTGNHGDSDYWIVKLNATGIIQWQKTLGGSETDKAYSVQQTIDGGYIVAGGSTSLDGDVTGYEDPSGVIQGSNWIVKLNETGTIQWQKVIYEGGSQRVQSIRQTLDEGYILITYSRGIGFGSIPQCSVIKLAAYSLSTPSFQNDNSFLIYPNPASSSTTISFSLSQSEKASLKIYDLNGRLVATLADKMFEMGENNVQWDAAGVSAGIYLLRYQTEESLQTEKFIVMK